MAGTIQVPGNDNSATISVKVTNPKTREIIEVKATKEAGKSEYSYVVWARLGDKLVITPQSTSASSSVPPLFFYPREINVSVEKNACPPALPVVEARPGLFLKGVVSPAVEGVNIQVFDGEGSEPVMTITTNKNGQYSAGPLHDDKEYELKASHLDYSIKKEESNPFNFLLRKMAKLVVLVTDKGSPVQGVLLSLSSSDGYINNNVTNADGIKIFDGLFPSDYYLRPVLKEYTFDPAALSVTLSEGEDKQTELKAKRVAFSVFGHVRTLNGNPAKHVSVEAIGPDGEYEEAKTDASGSYRLRGLKPGKTYTIRSKLTSAKGKEEKDVQPVERAAPESLLLTMKNEDVQHVDFVTFLKETKVDIMGKVDASPEFLGTLTVQLQTKGKEGSEEYSLGPGSFFLFPGVEVDATYTVTLTTTLSAKEYNFTLPTVTFSPKENQKDGKVLTDLTFTAEFRRMEERMDNGPFFTLLFVVAVAAGIYNKKTITQLIEKFNNKNKPQKVADNWEFDWKAHNIKNRK